jgi:hypothetical protein
MHTTMNTMLRKLTLALAASLVLAGASPAATLIDTGTPTGSLAAGVVDSSNFLALQFTADQAWTIDGVSAYLTGGQAGDLLAISLYASGAGLPADPLASVTFIYAGDGWNSASSLGWHLPAAGSYWFGIEGVVVETLASPGNWVPQGSFLAPAGGLTMPGATAFASGSGYTAYPGLQFGLQVTGAVPEPASLVLLLVGLGVVAGVAVRRSGAAGHAFRGCSTSRGG